MYTHLPTNSCHQTSTQNTCPETPTLKQLHTNFESPLAKLALRTNTLLST